MSDAILNDHDPVTLGPEAECGAIFPEGKLGMSMALTGLLYRKEQSDPDTKAVAGKVTFGMNYGLTGKPPEVPVVVFDSHLLGHLKEWIEHLREVHDVELG